MVPTSCKLGMEAVEDLDVFMRCVTSVQHHSGSE